MIRYTHAFYLSMLLLISPNLSQASLSEYMHMPAWFPSANPHNITKHHVFGTLAALFLLCSWRLFQKQGVPDPEPLQLLELLKIWNILFPSYWANVDKVIIGQRKKIKEITMTIYHEAIKEEFTKKEVINPPTGLFGYVIYDNIFRPLEDFAKQLKPLIYLEKSLPVCAIMLWFLLLEHPGLKKLL